MFAVLVCSLVGWLAYILHVPPSVRPDMLRHTHHIVFLMSLLVFYGPPTQYNKAPTTVWNLSVAARADKGPSSVCLHATHVHVKHEASLVGADYPIYIITLCVWNPVLLTHLALYKICLIPFHFFVPKFNFFSICIYWNARRIPFFMVFILVFRMGVRPQVVFAHIYKFAADSMLSEFAKHRITDKFCTFLPALPASQAAIWTWMFGRRLGVFVEWRTGGHAH